MYCAVLYMQYLTLLIIFLFISFYIQQNYYFSMVEFIVSWAPNIFYSTMIQTELYYFMYFVTSFCLQCLICMPVYVISTNIIHLNHVQMYKNIRSCNSSLFFYVIWSLVSLCSRSWSFFVFEPPWVLVLINSGQQLGLFILSQEMLFLD